MRHFFLVFFILLSALFFMVFSSESQAEESLGNPCTKFAIVSTGRTGSTLLALLLDQHKTILSFGEVLSKADSVKYNADRLLRKHLRLRKKSKLLFLEKLWDLCNRSPVVGFKLFPNHVTPEEMHLLLTDNSIKKIVLIRKNSIARAVSLEQAKTSRIWHKSKNDTSYTPPVVHINPVALQEEIKHYENTLHGFRTLLEKHNQPYITVYYEDLIAAHKQKTLNQVLDFLGASHPEENLFDKIQTRKIAERPLSERISNFEEVEHALKGTKWEEMLYSE